LFQLVFGIGGLDAVLVVDQLKHTAADDLHAV
jgi:hypothetical protein